MQQIPRRIFIGVLLAAALACGAAGAARAAANADLVVGVPSQSDRPRSRPI